MSFDRDYKRQIILDYGYSKVTEGQTLYSTLSLVSHRLNNKWSQNYPGLPSVVINANDKVSVKLPKIGSTRITVVVHGEPGGDLCDDNKNDIDIDNLAQKLFEIIKDNENVMVNLVACSGGKGSKQYSSNDADSAGAELQRRLANLTGKNIPVRARRNVVSVNKKGFKVVVDLDVPHDNVNDLSPEIHKQPGAVVEFVINEKGEQRKYDVYYTYWKNKFVKHLQQIHDHTANAGLKKETSRWLDAIKDKNIEEIFEFIKMEYENKKSSINTNTKDVIHKTRSLFHLVLPKLIEAQLILNSKHTNKERSIVAELSKDKDKWTLVEPTAPEESNQNETKQNSNELFLPSNIDLNEILQLNNTRLIKEVILLRPDLLKTCYDFRNAKNYFDERDHDTLFRLFLENCDKDTLLTDWNKQPDAFTETQSKDILDSYESGRLAVFCRENNKNEANVFKYIDGIGLLDLLFDLKNQGHKYDLCLLASKIENMEVATTIEAINQGLFTLDLPHNENPYKDLDTNLYNNKHTCLAILKNYHIERNSNTNKYLSFGGMFARGRDRATKLKAASVLMGAVEQAILNNSDKITIDLDNVKLKKDDFKRAVHDGRLKYIYAGIEKHFEIEFKQENKLRFKSKKT